MMKKFTTTLLIAGLMTFAGGAFAADMGMMKDGTSHDGMSKDKMDHMGTDQMDHMGKDQMEHMDKDKMDHTGK